LLLIQFPTEVPFFRYQGSEAHINELEDLYRETGQQNVEVIRSQLDRALAERANNIQSEMARLSLHPTLHRTYLGLILAGNHVLYIPDKGRPKSFKLDQFVQQRDGEGNLIELIIKERINKRLVPDEAIHSLAGVVESDTFGQDDDVDLFTHVYLTEKGWYKQEQQLSNGAVVGNPGEYKADELPWISPSWFRLDGEDYGIGLVTNYEGDFRTLEYLSESLNDSAMASSKTIFLVDPNAQTDIDALQEAPNLSFVVGSPEDIKVLQLDKYPDLQVVYRRVQDLEQSLSLAFLLNTAIQRQGERVTAEEIRFMAQEIENGLGGIYTSLSDELQLPVLRTVVARLVRTGVIEKLPESAARPSIVAGFDGLGRTQKTRRLTEVVGLVQQLGEQAISTLRLDQVVSEFFHGAGLDPDQYVKSAQEVQQEQQQEQAMALAQKAAGPAAGQAARGIVDASLQQSEISQ
jgi:hypothetical protein